MEFNGKSGVGVGVQEDEFSKEDVMNVRPFKPVPASFGFRVELGRMSENVVGKRKSPSMGCLDVREPAATSCVAPTSSAQSSIKNKVKIFVHLGWRGNIGTSPETRLIRMGGTGSISIEWQLPNRASQQAF